MKSITKYIFITLFFINCTLIFSATYYVSPNGNDSNSGNIENPFASFQKAHDSVVAGDTIFVRGGTYYPTSQTRFTRDGNANAYIVLLSYPGEVPIIDAENLPDGNINGGSTSTWSFSNAKYWKIIGPLTVTNGRGAGIYIEGGNYMEFNQIESSYNGKRASRAGHGFMVWSGDNISFINSDAHHNANHLWKNGENQESNQYQHGDGWRIFNGSNIKFVGCRGWNNLDDNFDFYGFDNPIELINCLSAYAGRDDSLGSITGIPYNDMPLLDPSNLLWGNGIKLGYNQDNVEHLVERSLSWNNNAAGFHMNLGPAKILNSISYGNKAFGFDYTDGNKHEMYNNWEYGNNTENVDYPEVDPDLTLSSHNSWDNTINIEISSDDFVSMNDANVFGQRLADGSYPDSTFLWLVAGSDLIDAGMDVGLPYFGSAIDINAFEFYDESVDVLAENSLLPSEFKLANYPNPFNPSTVIQYDLVESGIVNIVVYDILGRKVAELENEYRNAGTHKLTWNAVDSYGQGVASGTYLLRIQAGKNVKTIKMSYLR